MRNTKPKDLTGQTFGKLTVIKFEGYRTSPSGRKRFLWLCRCECGNLVITTTDTLKRNRRTSCGCSKKKSLRKSSSQIRKIKDYSKNKYDHMEAPEHGYSRTRLYNIWQAMKTRCYNKNHKYYKDYGGRGITVCPEWQHDFLKFREWALQNGYKENLTLDRIDVNGNYEPGNCRWATMKEQNENKRK